MSQTIRSSCKAKGTLRCGLRSAWNVGCALHDSANPAVSNATGSDPRFLEFRYAGGSLRTPKKVKVKMPALLLVKRHLPLGVLGRQVEPQSISIKPHPQSPSPTIRIPAPAEASLRKRPEAHEATGR